MIGADQMLVCEGRWFDKPRRPRRRPGQLLALRGRPHELVTAMVCWRGGQRIWQHLARPRLTMRDFSERLPRRLSGGGGGGGAGLGRRLPAGGLGVQLFARMEGEHSAILGLPLLPLLGFLRGHGVLRG